MPRHGKRGAGARGVERSTCTPLRVAGLMGNGRPSAPGSIASAMSAPRLSQARGSAGNSREDTPSFLPGGVRGSPPCSPAKGRRFGVHTMDRQDRVLSVVLSLMDTRAPDMVREDDYGHDLPCYSEELLRLLFPSELVDAIHAAHRDTPYWAHSVRSFVLGWLS